jgi:hypothetical protein
MQSGKLKWICLAVFAVTVAASAAASSVDGRWKIGNDGACVFDESDSGPDQCDPDAGRWKLGDDGGCYFDAQDTGPNQCVPPAPAPTVASVDPSSDHTSAPALEVTSATAPAVSTTDETRTSRAPVNAASSSGQS